MTNLETTPERRLAIAAYNLNTAASSRGLLESQLNQAGLNDKSILEVEKAIKDWRKAVRQMRMKKEANTETIGGNFLDLSGHLTSPVTDQPVVESSEHNSVIRRPDIQVKY